MKSSNYRKYTYYENGNFVDENFAPILAKKAGVSVKTIYNLSSKKDKQGKKEVYPVRK